MRLCSYALLPYQHIGMGIGVLNCRSLSQQGHDNGEGSDTANIHGDDQNHLRR